MLRSWKGANAQGMETSEYCESWSQLSIKLIYIDLPCFTHRFVARKSFRLVPGLRRASSMLSAEIEAKSGEVRLGAVVCNHHIGERPSGKNGQVVAKGLDSVGILLSRLQHIQAFPLCMGLRKRCSLETLRNAQLCEVVSYSYSEVACQAAITKVLDQEIRALGQIPDFSLLFSLACVYFVLNVLTEELLSFLCML